MMRDASFPDVRCRVAEFVKRTWPDNAEKNLQQLLSKLLERDVSEATAERVKYGTLVSQENFNALVNHFGKPFIDFVYAPLMGAAVEPTKAWITESAFHEAPAGHDIFVRDALGMLPSNTDHIRWAIRNLGWIAVERFGDGTTQLRHGESVVGRAIELAKNWLRTVSGPVAINDREFTDAASAIAALSGQKEATGAREQMLSARDWHICRQPLDSVVSPGLAQFVKARREAGDAPGTLPRILSEKGLLSHASLLHVKGDAVMSLWAGHCLGVNPSEVMGRDLRERPLDKRYNELVRAHAFQAIREPEGTFHRLRGIRIGNYRFDYDRVAFADQPGLDGSCQVATAVEITAKELVA